ncbi:hypothetical protein F66182_14583, partial [Fusarium sp. NRRL 66182]
MSTHHFEVDEPEQVIVKADEVDQTGTDISPVPDEELLAEVVDGLTLEPSPIIERQMPAGLTSGNARPTGRLGLVRDAAAAPPPPMQPPPPTPGQNALELAPDSLSLAQLRRIVQDIPKVEQQVYAFRYADTQPFPEELDEWFQYSEPERMMLVGSKVSFHQQWKEFCHRQSLDTSTSWLDADSDTRKTFLKHLLSGLDDSDLYTRIEALEAVCYAMCGVWGLTGGRPIDDYPENPTAEEESDNPRTKSLQIKWIVDN